MTFEITHVFDTGREGFSLSVWPGVHYKHGEFIAMGLDFQKDGKVTVRNRDDYNGPIWYRWPSIQAAKAAIGQFLKQYNISQEYSVVIDIDAVRKSVFRMAKEKMADLQCPMTNTISDGFTRVAWANEFNMDKAIDGLNSWIDHAVAPKGEEQ